jgi:hypothetical protein
LRFRCLLSLPLLLVASVASADSGQHVGKVKRCAGSVKLERAGLAQPVHVGSTLHVGDRVRTGSDGAVGITLADDTLLTAGPNSTLLINDFRFDPTTREGNMLTTLLKGTLSVVTGLLARQTPENVSFRTPNVTLGIRGTEFIIETRGEDE